MLETRLSRGTDHLRPPDDLPADPDRFFRGELSNSAVSLHDQLPAEQPSALDRLGSSPIPKSGFPFLGFLQGVYEHVSSIARGEQPQQDA
jgi:hypothetical protein